MDVTADDDNSEDADVEMAECGVLTCRAIIPLDSKSCPTCGVSFSGVAEEQMGECGACGALVPIDSKSCPQCGVHFVLDDLTTELSNWMKEEALTISELFGVVDVDNDGSLSSAEIKAALLDRDLAFLGSNELDRFLSQIDLNDDGVISFPELAAALSMPWNPPEEMTVLEPDVSDDKAEDEDSSDDEEEVEDDSDDEEDDDDDSDEAVKEAQEETESGQKGPAEWQRFLMRNYENAFPIMYTIGALFVGFWLINAMGILVDGSGGPIAYDGDPISEISADTNWVEEITLDTGDIYPCDKEIQESGCKNSLTPLSGVNGASSMPAGFHLDGILFMVLGLVGLGGVAYLQMQIKALRASHRRKKGENADPDSDTDSMEKESQEDDADDSDDEKDADDSDDEKDADDSDDEEDADDSDDEEDTDDSDDDEESDDDGDDEDSEDGIEIGSRVGVEDEDGDWYGEVVEFDDDEDAVVVKREDDGEEYVVDWDSLFQDD